MRKILIPLLALPVLVSVIAYQLGKQKSTSLDIGPEQEEAAFGNEVKNACREQLENQPDNRLVEEYGGTPKSVDFTTLPEAKTFYTAITEAVASGPDYAGHFTLAHWGCGAPCFGYAVVDAITGEIVAFSPVNENYLLGSYSLDNRILVLEPVWAGQERKYFRIVEAQNGKSHLEFACAEILSKDMYPLMPSITPSGSVKSSSSSNNAQSVIDPDPITNCVLSDAEHGAKCGNPHRLRQSVCGQSVCCWMADGSWRVKLYSECPYASGVGGPKPNSYDANTQVNLPLEQPQQQPETTYQVPRDHKGIPCWDNTSSCEYGCDESDSMIEARMYSLRIYYKPDVEYALDNIQQKESDMKRCAGNIISGTREECYGAAESNLREAKNGYEKKYNKLVEKARELTDSCHMDLNEYLP